MSVQILDFTIYAYSAILKYHHLLGYLPYFICVTMTLQIKLYNRHDLNIALTQQSVIHAVNGEKSLFKSIYQSQNPSSRATKIPNKPLHIFIGT